MKIVNAPLLLTLVACFVTAHGRGVDEHRPVKKPQEVGSPEMSDSSESLESEGSDESVLGVTHELTGPKEPPPAPVKSLRPGGAPYVHPKKSNRRNKRATCGHPTTLDSTQMLQSVVYHNNYRANEGAADVMKLIWNEELAARAQEWADQCLWKHGMLTDCSGQSVGQNLYMVSKGSTYPDVNMQSVINAWFNEKPFYNFTSTTCQPGRMCGHYTQVVWGTSAEVGCAAAQCAEVTEGVTTPWYNALIVACDYRPAGNYRGEQPYVKGPACSRCHENPNSIGYKCDSDLCADCDPVSQSGCTCIPRTCQNGGNWNNAKCACDCSADYYGRLCEGSCKCENKEIYRDYCPGWLSYCTNPPYIEFMKDYCPQTCGNCEEPPAEMCP